MTMCGIAGVVSKKTKVDQGRLRSMLQVLAHRGPEDEGVWYDDTGRVGLGQRRLAIIDLSPGGHQPMISPDKRFIVTFNGEIYNYLELRHELQTQGFSFRSESDTEVLLAAFIAWGKGCVHKLRGMFAFAVWDEKEQTLFAARDRLGEKPFKYYAEGDRFIFASELKAILAYESVPREVDWLAIDVALTYRYVPAPRTGFKNIHKLPAGHTLTWKEGGVTVEPYWQPHQFANIHTARSLEEWKELLWNTFEDSVKERLISDVPVGAFLSGGLDSSSVVAAMARISSRPVKTFSVGFKNHPESETPYAELVAKHYGTEHTNIFIEPNIITILPKLIHHYEEPFFDNSAVPSMAMAEETKKHVTVVLSGDGGDECFGGYPNHTFFKYVTWYHRLPRAVYGSLIPGALDVAGRLIPKRAVKKAAYRAELLSHNTLQAYVDYYGIWQKEFPRTQFYLTKQDLYTETMWSSIRRDHTESLMGEWLGQKTVQKFDPLNRSMLADLASRLPDDYLVKVDIASMAYALETRPPFLDHRLVEASLSLPAQYKVRNGDVKWIWKEIMKNKLPETILTRRKMGFGIPIIGWMRNELYGYLQEELLGGSSLMDSYIRKEVVEQLLKKHKSGEADYSNHLWSLLLLRQWLRTYFSV